MHTRVCLPRRSFSGKRREDVPEALQALADAAKEYPQCSEWLLELRQLMDKCKDTDPAFGMPIMAAINRGEITNREQLLAKLPGWMVANLRDTFQRVARPARQPRAEQSHLESDQTERMPAMASL